jgi:uncharacterized protein (TIGR03790 family)
MKQFGVLCLGLGIGVVVWLAARPFATGQIFDEATLKEQLNKPSNPDVEATVVAYNDNDRDSRELAKFYAAKRGIPKDHLIALNCPMTEDITRAEYDRDIAEPLRKVFEKKGWWELRVGESALGAVEKSSIRFLALMRGVPLRIKATFEPYAGDQIVGPQPIATHNEAAVDSELSVLGAYSHQISGALNNPYFRSFSRSRDANLPSLLMVCRLDAPTPDVVRRMIADSLAVEQEGLRGFVYIDARGTKEAGLKVADDWMLNAAKTARQKGMPVILDASEPVFPPTYPMRNVAFYLGWYAENMTGPFTRPDFRFQRGAIAVHLHSFSAMSLRDPPRYWCAPFLMLGAAATLGNVYEPYLGLTPALDIFHDRLRAGFTFGESAYASQRFLSWMTTFVGDPLYRPFQKELELGEHKAKDEWEAYAEGTRTWFGDNPQAGKTALEASAKKFKSGVVMEGLGLLQVANKDPEGAVESFEQAAKFYANPEDVVRATIHEVLQLQALSRTPDAIALAQRRITSLLKTPSVELLKTIEAEMVASSPKTADSATPRP